METTVDLRRMHVVVADSLARFGTRWMFRILPVAMLAAFLDQHFVLAPLVIFAGRLAWCVLGWLIRPLVATANGVEIDGVFQAWDRTRRVTPPGRKSLVFCSYRCVISWLVVGWRPYLLVGEAEWLAAIVQLRDRTRSHAYR